MSDKVDKLFEQLEAEKLAKQQGDEQLRQSLQTDDTALERIQEERKNKVSGFKLDLDLDEEFAEHTEEAAAPADHAEGVETAGEAPAEQADEGTGLPPMMLEEEPVEEPLAEEPVQPGEEAPETPAKKKKKKKKDKTTWG